MIDFSIHSGRGSGSTIEVGPGNPEPVDGEFIRLDEEAFFAIEGFFPFGRIDHYGVRVIESVEWALVMKGISEEYYRITQEMCSVDFDLSRVSGWPWLARHPLLLSEVLQGGISTLRSMIDMLKEFSDIGRGWTESYRLIYVYGV